MNWKIYNEYNMIILSTNKFMRKDIKNTIYIYIYIYIYEVDSLLLKYLAYKNKI